MWHTVGHLQVKNILEKQLTANVFPHAYLFTGPEGVGKKELALEFASKILEKENVLAHPDFALLDIEGEIIIDPALEFLGRLAVKPFVGKWKVAVVNNAHNLNTHAANALLKTLEEPSPSTILILVSSRGSLLPTIRSRCQVFYFRGLSAEELGDFAKSKKISTNSELVELSFGSPSRLLRLSEDKEFAEITKQSIREFTLLQHSPVSDRLLAIPNFAEKETEELAEIFTTWTLWEYEQLKQKPAGFPRVEKLLNAISDTNTNKNKKLILQDLFLKI